MEKRLKEAGKQEQFYSIALFDILGFSNYVTTHGNQTILELYNKLLDIVYTPDIGKAVPIRMSDDWKEGQYIANANGHVNVCHFSDTFIIYVHYLCRREAYWLATPKYEPYPLLLGEKDTPYCPIFYQEHQIYLSFLQTCMDFFCQSIIAGIPLRGCVSSGFALMDSNKSGAVVVVSSVIFSLPINSPFHTIKFCYPSSQSPSPPLSSPWLLPPGNSYQKREPAHTVPVCGHKSLRGQGLAGS